MISIISSDEAYNRLDVPFNPKAPPAVDTEAFEDEWHRVKNGLLEKLSVLGEWNAYGQGDFYLGDGFSRSRGIGLEVHTDKMLTPKLIDCIQSYLSGLESEYEIYVSFSWNEEPVNMFVSAGEVLMDNAEALRLFDAKGRK